MSTQGPPPYLLNKRPTPLTTATKQSEQEVISQVRPIWQQTIEHNIRELGCGDSCLSPTVLHPSLFEGLDIKNTDHLVSTKEAVEEIISQAPKLSLNQDNHLANRPNNSSLPPPIFPSRKQHILQAEILSLCKVKFFHRAKETQQIVSRAKSLSLFLNEKSVVKSSTKAKSVLGMFLCLLNQDPEQLIRLCNEHKLDKSLAEAIAIFFKSTDGPPIQTEAHMLRRYKLQRCIGLSPSADVLSTQTPLLLAHLLVNDDGKINYGIIKHLKKKYSPEKLSSQGAKSDLYYGLEMLEQSSLLRQKIEALQAPHSNTSPGAYLIRISLGYPLEHPLTSCDVKKVALAGLLSHIRQGKEDSCFATSLLSCVHSSRLGRCLDDFGQLLTEGAIHRNISGKIYSFPFLLKTGAQSGKITIRLNTKAEHCDTKTPLHLIPEIQAACRSIGLYGSQASEVISQALSKFFKRQVIKKEEVTLSIDELFTLILREKSLVSRERELKDRMLFAFDAESQPVLLDAWKNAVASMAEANHSGVMHQRCLNSILTAFHEKFSKYNYKEFDSILKLFTSIIESYWVFAYDPSLSTEHSPIQGGFMLFDSHLGQNPSQWIPCNTPKRFQQLIIRCLSLVKGQLTSSFSIDECELAEHVLSILKNYAESKFFVEDTMRIFDSYIPQSQNPVLEYAQLSYTPWRCIMGNNPQQLFDTYWEQPLGSHYHSFCPYNAENLLCALINMVKALSDSEKHQLLKNPFQKTPIFIRGTHAFSLTLGSKSMACAWANQAYTPSWIRSVVIQPGEVFANTLTTPKYRRRVLNSCRSELLRFKTERELFDLEVENYPKKLSFFEFRNRVEKDLKASKYQPSSELASELDTIFYQNLSDKKKQQIRKKSIRFADTNWKEDGCDVTASFVYSPFSKQLEIWTEMGENFKSFGNLKWRLDQEWSFHHNPCRSLPSDGTENTMIGSEKSLEKRIRKLKSDSQLLCKLGCPIILV